jgi:glutathione S-transferase
MTLRLHDYVASGNCYKVRLLLAQLGLEYERVPVDIFGGDTLTDEYARLNPLRQTPVLERDDGEPLSESNAILLYLADGTPLLPEDPADRAQVYRWLFFEQAELIPAIAGLRFRLLTGRLEPDAPAAQARRRAAEQLLGLLADHLADSEFLVRGGYSVADIAVYAYVHVAGDAGASLPDAVRSWIERVEAQPGFMNDLQPYPPNARLGTSVSIYDA